MSAKKKTSRQDPEEPLEVYNERGKKIGVRKRSEVHGNPSLIHRVAHVLVFNTRGELYLQRRSADKDVQPGKWDTSVGGHVNPGESFLHAAQRELREELGVEERLELIHLYDYRWESDIETEDVRTYAVEYDGPIRPDPEEISEGRFWSLPEIDRAMHSQDFTPNLRKELELCRNWSHISIAAH